MTDQHRATPEQWAKQEHWAAPPDFDPYATCLLELRARIQALEATQQPHTFTADEVAPFVVRATSADAQPADSLMDRVADAIYDAPNNHDGCWRSEARAAIREIAAWLRENGSQCEKRPLLGGDAAAIADLLNNEANR